MFSLTTLFDALIPASIRQMSRRAGAASSCGTHVKVQLTVFVESKSGAARAVTRALALAFSHQKAFPQRSSPLYGSTGLAAEKVIKLSLLGSFKQLQIEQPPRAQL